MVNTAIFLGAGASKAEGAPLQGELFSEYFSSELFNTRSEMDKALKRFFHQMFGIDVSAAQNTFPTFEEVLGLTDLAILRKEAFRHFDLDGRTADRTSLRLIAQYLVFLVAKILHAKLEHRAQHHRVLVEQLCHAGELLNVAFISTNYDILIDNALNDQYNNGFDIDYGIDFRNFERTNTWQPPRPGKGVPLFKPHGSLNWLFCPTCCQLEITSRQKGVVRLISEVDREPCYKCRGDYSPLIVPPTFYKDLSNTFLSTIWNKTNSALQSAKHVIFCGYSFPDADIHIKYLLKRAQTNRKSPEGMRVTVINGRKERPKPPSEEEMRYTRFLGPHVNYLNLSFEEFAADPIKVMRSRNKR